MRGSALRAGRIGSDLSRVNTPYTLDRGLTKVFWGQAFVKP
jgi:hypothetical protein